MTIIVTQEEDTVTAKIIHTELETGKSIILHWDSNIVHPIPGWATFVFFAFNAKLLETAILASKDLTTAEKKLPVVGLDLMITASRA